MKILQIAYYYQPMGGAGVQRALKFSKYLPEFGVQPVVLAALDKGYLSDASLVAEIPVGVAVHRVEHQALMQRVLAWRARRSSSSASGATAPTSAPSALRASLRDAALGAYAALQFPDDKAGWARRALNEARRILRSERVDLILSSSPPVSAHRLGAQLAHEFGLPWVADFRDLWTANPGYAAPAWRRALDRRSEDGWLQRAAGIVTVTPSWQRLLAERAACPVAFIPNGYDKADFIALAAASRDDAVFRLVHTGSFYGPRDPAGLLAGVAEYLATASAAARPLRLRLVGSMGARFEAGLAQFEQQHPGVIERRPYVPHQQALAEMMAADALLLVVGGGQGDAVAGWLPGKIFEYLRAAKPVLLLGDEAGDAATLIRRHAQGWVVDEAAPARIAAALRAMIEGPSPAVEARAGVACFERRELARQLAEFLARCAQAGRQ